MKNILYIGNKLSKKGVNPTTIDILGERLKTDFHVIRISDKLNQILRILDMWINIFRLRNKIDFILIDTYSTSAFHFAWTSARLSRYLNIPYVPILHGGDLPKRAKNSTKIFQTYLFYAEKVISPSAYLKNKLKIQGNKRIQIIPNFLDLEKYPFTERSKMEGIKLLWVRAFAEVYNPKLALYVVKSLMDKGYSDVQLCMVGPDKEGILEGLKALTEELNIKENVIFKGKLPKKKWLELSKSYNLFLNTTRVDNTPVSVMEAMVLGIPVISTDVGGIPYMIKSEQDGMIVKNDDIQEMTEVIIRLEQNDLLYHSISLAARNKGVNWDWEIVREKWVKALSQIERKYKPNS